MYDLDKLLNYKALCKQVCGKCEYCWTDEAEGLVKEFRKRAYDEYSDFDMPSIIKDILGIKNTIEKTEISYESFFMALDCICKTRVREAGEHITLEVFQIEEIVTKSIDEMCKAYKLNKIKFIKKLLKFTKETKIALNIDYEMFLT